jgi:hypothetical protein
VLVAEGNQVAARLTYTGTHRGPIWASRRPTGASSMPALRSSGSAMDASPMDGGSAIPPRCARSSPVRPGGKSRVRRAFRDRHLLVAATLISSRTPKREHVPVKPDGSKPTASLADAVRPADPISNRKSDKAAESDHGHAGRDPLVPSTANARLQTGTNRPGDQVPASSRTPCHSYASAWRTTSRDARRAGAALAVAAITSTNPSHIAAAMTEMVNGSGAPNI